MREVNFFKTLQEETRQNNFNMFTLLPSKTKFPAWECDLLESKTYEDHVIFKIQIRGYFKDLNKDEHIREKERLKDFLHTHLFLFKNTQSYSLQLLNEKFLPREKGELQTLQSEWLFLLRHKPTK